MTVYHVAIGYVGPEQPVEKIQAALANDGWARYAPNCWLVSSRRSANDIAVGIRAFCSPQDSILVIEVNVKNYQGYLQKEIWDWFNR